MPKLKLASETDNLKYNMRSIFQELSDKKYDPLTKEEELRLIREAKNGNERAKKTVVEKNLRYVAKMASKYSSPGTDKYMELISAGTIGLYKALEKFDPDKGLRFLTFATKYIWHEMYNLLTSDLTVLSLPTSQKRIIVAIYRLLPDLEKKLGRTPTVKELIDCLKEKYPKLKIREDFVIDVIKKRHLSIPLEEIEKAEEKISDDDYVEW